MLTPAAYLEAFFAMRDNLFDCKKQELLDYAKGKYQDQLSIEERPIGSSIVMHYLSLNGVEIGLVAGGYSLGIHADKDLLYEARGACARVVNQKRFLVFGAQDLTGLLVDPFTVKFYKDGVVQHMVGPEHMEQVEGLFRMLLVLAMGW
jgi:hypothetical protein